MGNPNKWYAIIGGTSAGKTTLVDELRRRGYQTVPEAARQLVDEARAQGISTEERRADEEQFQQDVLLAKIENERATDPDQLTFFDRGMQDTVAYMQYYNYPHQPWIDEVMERSHYRGVFYLEPLPVFEKDYIRIEDDDFSRRIGGLLIDAYTQYGMPPISVPLLEGGVKARVDFVLEHVMCGEE